MVDVIRGWSWLLNRYLFHWTPVKALWIGEHTLVCDARCANIYIRVGSGVLCQFIARRTAGRMSSFRIMLFTALFMLPLFGDALAIATNLKIPQNDTRYLTGLSWRAAFSVYLLPAFLILTCSPGHRAAAVTPWKFFAPLVVASVWFMKGWDHIIAYYVLGLLGIFGCLTLAGIRIIGLFQAVMPTILPRGSTTIVTLFATVVLLSACTATQTTLRSGACNEADFVSSPYACLACKKEMCIRGQIVTVEDLSPAAPVDDWAEERFCLRHPINCYRAYALKHQIERWQKELVGTYWTNDALHNGLGDASRHVYLMCELTEQSGAAFARAVGMAHEQDSGYLMFIQKGAPSNPCCEKITDLSNNEIGIDLAGAPGTCEEKTLRSLHRLQHSMCETKDKVMER
jgi:uncharacterized membrane protein